MSGRLHGKTVAFVVANEGIEQVELTDPWDAVKAAGGEPVLVAPKSGEAQAFNHLDKGDTFPVDRTTVDAKAEDFDGVVLPGGVANPDQLRTDGPVVEFLQSFAATGRPIAAICHGPWTLIEAGVIDGRTITSWPSIRTDLENAGGSWVDRELVVDGQLITSRKPDDLPAFCDQLVSAVEAASR